MGIEITPPGPESPSVLAASLTAYGNVTGPAASGAISTVATPAAGIYSITITYEVSGTLTSAEQDNFKLVVNGSQLARMLFNVPASGVAGPFTWQGQVSTNGVNSIIVSALAAAGAAAVYAAEIVATRVE